MAGKIGAYVLINTKLGNAEQVLKELSKIPQITSVASTTGMYDVIVKVYVNQLEELDDVLTKHIQCIDGIIRTETQVIIREHDEAQ